MDKDTTILNQKRIEVSENQPRFNKLPNQKWFLLIVVLVIIMFVIVAIVSYSLGKKSAMSNLSNIQQTIPDPTSAGENIPIITPIITPTPTVEEYMPNNPVTGVLIPTAKPVNFIVPAGWSKTSIINNTLTLCLPPKWEADQWGNVYYNRDAAYRPNVTYVQSIPYTSGSRREAYYKYWELEYPNVRNLVSFRETNVNSNTVLTIFPVNTFETKTAPDSNLAVIWFAKGKLWKAGLSGWSDVNNSQSTFLKDFYTAISCSF